MKQIIKRILLWTFERGSFQWNVMCLLILAFLFLIPRQVFRDVPEFMKVSATESVHKTVDNNGNPVFTVKLDTPHFLDTVEVREATREMLEQSLAKPVNVSRWQPIRDWTGRVIAYAIWKEK
jgi:hypothetical protein